MITLKSPQQVDRMREAGKLLYEVETALREAIHPGITTNELDRMAERMIRDAGAIPSFKGFEGFPATICASPDDMVVHGFPDDKPIESGHILSVDCGLVLHGWQADSAFTAPVGEIPKEIQELIRVTEECFWLGAAQAREGNRLGDIGYAVQEHAEKHGFGVVRDLTGHGIGTEMHEDPSVPNFGKAGRGLRLRAGMTIAIEPMIAKGDWKVYVKDDGWGVVTRDHSWCSHYEHTLAITGDKPEILTYHGPRVSEDVQ
ncbi:MAG: type I methionyl aminopeptidase [Clostridia bacterium]|nr:type I methionyl aminopeptidase [Clostridia bacterium]